LNQPFISIAQDIALLTARLVKIPSEGREQRKFVLVIGIVSRDWGGLLMVGWITEVP
jgi:hypothetical protein